jgi:hypothetical protein
MHREIAGVGPNRMGKLSDSSPSTQRFICNQIAATWAKRGIGCARRAELFGISTDTLEDLLAPQIPIARRRRRGVRACEFCRGRNRIAVGAHSDMRPYRDPY